ncbi:bile acid:sodium symporter family protein [Radiobacillus kanasensis]|uniref:bile acid:sodium symporter family protein n=1 Tax=Radiobacillus kanasensis TaxID=2844358 RepID=UPI001E5B2E47|nr:bile acid:sodium symporter family protein [Radiobacillus kanasensis]UFT99692.1 bile acid:sodium symporter family protein [Radiobacillus kanasensis]
MLVRINHYIEKWMAIIAPLSVLIGVMLESWLAPLAMLVPWIFAFMTFTGSLGSTFESLKRAVLHPIPIILILGILHIVMPLWAWGMGSLAFRGDSFTITGLILGMIIPTGITSFIWVSMKRGHVALTLSIILIDTIISPFVVPFTLSLFVGESVEMNVWDMMKGLIGMIVVPSILGMILNHLTKGESKKVLSPILSPFSKLGLASVIMINSAVVAPYLVPFNAHLIKIAVVVFTIAFTGYLLSWLFARWLRQEDEVVIALTFTGGMRNISAGAVIAVAYFPYPVAVPVVIGMLFQQVLASIYGYIIEKRLLSKPVVQYEKEKTLKRD